LAGGERRFIMIRLQPARVANEVEAMPIVHGLVVNNEVEERRGVCTVQTRQS
jgi:hypothetical protein